MQVEAWRIKRHAGAGLYRRNPLCRGLSRQQQQFNNLASLYRLQQSEQTAAELKFLLDVTSQNQ